MKNWKDCGYISYTKKGDGILLALKHKNYFIKPDELLKVVQHEMEYALVYEPQGTELRGGEKYGQRPVESIEVQAESQHGAQVERG